MGSIASLSVSLTANISSFTANMTAAAAKTGAVSKSFSRALDTGRAWNNFSANLKEFKLAGSDTIRSLETTLAVARSSLRQFSRNRDVQVAIEFGREQIAEAWIKGREQLRRLASATKLDVALHIASARTASIRTWLSNLRGTVGRGLNVPIHFAQQQFAAGAQRVQSQFEKLKRFRAVRIGLTLVDRLKLPLAAAKQALAPLRTLAGKGLKLAISASYAGAVSGIKAIGGALGGLKSLAGSVLSGVAAGVAGIVVAAAGVAVGLGAMVSHTMESIDATAKLSDRLGIATEKLTGLQYAGRLAGLSNDTLTEGFDKMLKSIGEAAEGTGDAGVAFAHLGLNVKALGSMPTDQAFGAIAEKLRGIDNASERAAVTTQIFGRSGAELLPLLMKGSEGIAEAEAEAKKLGITFSRVDAAKVEAAGEAMRRLQAVGEGALNTLAIQLAPFLEVVTQKLVTMATTGRGVTGWIVTGFGFVLTAAANVMDYITGLEAGWQLMRGVAAVALGGIVDGIGDVLDALGWLLKKLHLSNDDIGQSAHQLAAGLKQVSQDAFADAGQKWKDFQDGTNSKKAQKLIDDIQASSNKAAQSSADAAGKLNGAAASTENFSNKLSQAADNAKKVTDTIADLKKEVATFGMDEGQKKLFDLRALGAGPDQIADAQKMVDQLEKLGNAKKATDALKDLQKEFDQFSMTDAQKKVADLKLPGVDDGTLAKIKDMAAKLDAMKEAKSVFDDTRTPMEKYETQIGKLGDLLNSGAINWDTYGRAVRKARAELEKTAETKSPDLMVAGSAAAQQYEYQQQHHVDAFNNAPGIAAQNASKNKLDERSFNETFQSRLLLQQIRNYMVDQTSQALTVVDLA